MTLQSSGQIKLSEIATEFGGSTPHSLSEYYSGGSNVPSGTQNASGVTIPTSGEIQLAADFYGSVAEVVLAQVTVNSIGTTSFKSNCNHYGYSTSASQNGNGGTAMGSITSASGFASGMTCAYLRDDSAAHDGGFGGNDVTKWRFSGGSAQTFSSVRFTNNQGQKYTVTSFTRNSSTGIYEADHGSFNFNNRWVGRSSMLVEFIQ